MVGVAPAVVYTDQCHADALRHLGCTVRHCENGDEALRILDKHSPDYELVVSDVVMPGNTDGVALAQYVRKQYPHMKIVLMTGYTHQLPDAEALGLKVYLKPLDLAALRTILGAGEKKASEVMRRAQ